VGDPHVGVGGRDEPLKVVEVLRDRLRIPAGEVTVRCRVHGQHLTAELSVDPRRRH